MPTFFCAIFVVVASTQLFINTAQAQPVERCRFVEVGSSETRTFDASSSPAAAVPVEYSNRQTRRDCMNTAEYNDYVTAVTSAGAAAHSVPVPNYEESTIRDRMMSLQVGDPAGAYRRFDFSRDAGVLTVTSYTARGANTTRSFVLYPRGGDFDMSVDSSSGVLRIRRGGGITMDFNLAQGRFTGITGGTIRDGGAANNFHIDSVDGIVADLGSSSGEAPHANAARYNPSTGTCTPRTRARGAVTTGVGAVSPREAFTFATATGRVSAPFLRDGSGMACALDYADLFTWTVRPSCEVTSRGTAAGATCTLQTDPGGLARARCISSRGPRQTRTDCVLRAPCEPTQISVTDAALSDRMDNYAGGICSRTGLEPGTNRFMRLAPLARGTGWDESSRASDRSSSGASAHD